MVKNIFLGMLTLAILIFTVILSVNNFYQNQNIQHLLEQHLDGRMIPHKVDYTNKLKNVLSDHLRSFEFDTLFNNRANPPFFEVGHDETEINGTSFESYLQLAKKTHLKKIWMDIKNVNRGNVKSILARLNYLDRKYGIKDIMIFETGATVADVKIISDAGYYTTYYLPSTVLPAVTTSNMAAMVAEARRIKKQIQAQHLKAISFPISLYWFVKACLEPVIPDYISYHTWGAYRFRKKDELMKIQHEEYYRDSKVKTIIYSYYNNKFNRLYDFEGR